MSAEIPRIHFLIDRGRFKEAETLLREALAKEPDHCSLHLLHSQVLCELDRPKEGVEAARRAIGLEPDSGLPHEVLAQALLKSERWKEAEAAVMAATALDGDDADRRGLLAKIYLERGKYPQSVEHAEAGLAIDPDHELCRFFRGIALGKLGRHAEADEASMGLLSDDPEDSYNHAARGWILMERGAMDEARLHFKEALRLDADNEGARIGLAQSLQRQHPLLGWLLRLVIAVGKIPLSWQLLGAAVLVFMVPRFLEGPGKTPLSAGIAHFLKNLYLVFFSLALATPPLFDALLAISRDGRLALGTRQIQALRWCALPLLGGFGYLIHWMSTGSKNVPYQALALLATAVMIHEAFTTSHPWVRRRLLAISGAMATVAAWITVGPHLVLPPMWEPIAEKISRMKGNAVSAKEIAKLLLEEVERLLNFTKWAFVYPALALYLAASFSDNIATALLRRAPDESD